MEKLVYLDGLTKVYNRRGFLDLTKKILKEISIEKNFKKRKTTAIQNCSLILFDIDNFKKINDTYGNSVGDKVLKVLCLEIKNRIREIDIIGRWGGEEIIVFLVGIDKNNAFKVGDYIRQKIEKRKIKAGNKYFHFSISGGVTDFSKIKDFKKVFELVDQALYKAKKTGKNKIVIA